MLGVKTSWLDSLSICRWSAPIAKGFLNFFERRFGSVLGGGAVLVAFMRTGLMGAYRHRFGPVRRHRCRSAVPTEARAAKSAS